MFAQIVNFGNASINLKISVVGLGSKQVRSVGSTKTILTSSNLKDENSYKEPNKVHHHSLFITFLHFDCGGMINVSIVCVDSPTGGLTLGYRYEA